MSVSSILILIALPFFGNAAVNNDHRQNLSMASYNSLVPASQAAIKLTVEPVESNIEKRRTRVFKQRTQMRFKLVATNNSPETIRIILTDPYDQTRPILRRSGRPIEYLEETTKLLEKRKSFTGYASVATRRLHPDEPVQIETIDLSDWYAPLDPGTYELSIKHRFRDEWVESSLLEFEVEP